VTILSVIRDAAPFISLGVPEAVMASTEREHVELAATANEMAERIAEAHEWQLLKRQHSITGNGSDDAWDLPADFDRLPLAQQVWSSARSYPLEQVTDEDEWLGRQVVFPGGMTTGSFIIIGGQMVFDPVLASGEVAKFYYLTNLAVEDEDGETKAAFTADTDTFRLDERLLKLAIIWRWKQAKGLPFEVWLADFNLLLAQRVGRDGARKPIATGRPRYRDAGSIALPWTIVEA
jgi:hypothetical protein